MDEKQFTSQVEKADLEYFKDQKSQIQEHKLLQRMVTPSQWSTDEPHFLASLSLQNKVRFTASGLCWCTADGSDFAALLWQCCSCRDLKIRDLKRQCSAPTQPIAYHELTI